MFFEDLGGTAATICGAGNGGSGLAGGCGEWFVGEWSTLQFVKHYVRISAEHFLERYGTHLQIM